MKEIPVKFKGGYAFTLRFTMDIWERLENEVAMIGDIGEKISAGKNRLRASAQVAAILADDENVTSDTIWQAMVPADLRRLNTAITLCISENLKMETTQEDEGEIHDVILEEIEAKKETAG